MIGARAADQRVIPVAALEEVRTTCAAEHVVAAEPVKTIGAGCAGQCVVARGPVEVVIAVRHVEIEGLARRESARVAVAIANRHGHRDGGARFVVERGTRLQLQRVADHLEP